MTKMGLLFGLLNILSLISGDQVPLRPAQTCLNPSLSCPSPIPSPLDSCCLNHPSGHFLLTQFWDAKPAFGASDAWTIHGLWPDLCSGGFDQFCDSSRSYSNISSILKDISPSTNLLSFMNKNWLSLNGDNNHLWSHEWSKHGTCVSTLDSDCYSSSANQFDSVLDYFNHATNLYLTLDTYSVLASRDIVPSTSTTYTLSDLQNAISPSHDDFSVTLRCHGHELNEIWYHYIVRGSLRDALAFNSSTSAQETKDIFIPTAPDGAKSNCPASGIQYLPKDSPSPSSILPTTATHTAHPSPTSTSPTLPFAGRGHLVVRVLNSDSNTATSPSSSEYKGCLIRGAKWYLTSGTSCATFLAKEDVEHLSPLSSSSNDDDDDEPHLFTLSSLYSPCAISPLTTASGPAGVGLIASEISEAGLFTCAKDLGVQSIFSYVNVTGSSDTETSSEEAEDNTRSILKYSDSTTFYASKVPEKFEKVELYVTDGDGDGEGDDLRSIRVEIEWEGV